MLVVSSQRIEMLITDTWNHKYIAVVSYTSYSSNSKPSMTKMFGTWFGGGRSNPWASSQVIFNSIMSSLSILRRLLLEPRVLFFLFLEIEGLAPKTSFAMYPDLSTFVHEVGSASSAWLIHEKKGDPIFIV